MDYKVTIEADERHVAWWVVVNGQRVGTEFQSEDDAILVGDWLGGLRRSPTPSVQPALPQIAQAAGYIPAGEAVAYELPVLGTAGASKLDSLPPGEWRLAPEAPPTFDVGVKVAPAYLSASEALQAYDNWARRALETVADEPVSTSDERQLRRILERRRS